MRFVPPLVAGVELRALRGEIRDHVPLVIRAREEHGGHAVHVGRVHVDPLREQEIDDRRVRADGADVERVRVLVVADRDVGPEVEQELRHLEVPRLGRDVEGRRAVRVLRREERPVGGDEPLHRRRDPPADRLVDLACRDIGGEGEENHDNGNQPHRTHGNLLVHRKRPEIFCKALSFGGIGAIPAGLGAPRYRGWTGPHSGSTPGGATL